MKKRKLLNLFMVLVIVLTAVCAVMAVGSVKGWFQQEEKKEEAGLEASLENIWKIQDKSGIVFIERNGISYEVKINDVLRNQDVLCTKTSSDVTIADAQGKEVVLSANSELVAESISEMAFELTEGEAAVNSSCSQEPMVIGLADAQAVLQNAAVSISVHAASKMIYVYSGEVTVSNEAWESPVMAKAGNVISVLTTETGEINTEVSTLMPEALSDAQIQKILEISASAEVCFTSTELEAVLAAREEEKQAAKQAQVLLKDQAQENLQKEQDEYERKSQEASESDRQETASSQSASESTGTGSGKSDDDSRSAEDTYSYCTIEIRCDTILQNMDQLSAGKEGYVPSNGVILATSAVEFSEGETVFEVLKRACSRADIQLEYSFTPLYNSYYIEGISHLYEFDCGNESGWMYKVNGWFPNYGCSSYELSDGDTIVWCYTCNGLGADVGGSNY